MKLALMTSLALPLAAAMTSEETAAQHNPVEMSWGTEKNLLSALADVADGGWMESLPSYCTMPPPNPTCYRQSRPACCFDPDQECPEERPPCECDGDCVGCTHPDAEDCDDDEFCMLPTGDCRMRSATIAGTCAPIPQMCTYEMNPVCGCDGVTYPNPCGAQGAGVSVMHADGCKDVTRRIEPPGPDDCTYDNVGHIDDGTCGPGRFCTVAAGQCNTRIGTIEGTCAPIPQMCTLEMNPVCGCDGTTYANPCAARTAGASVSHDGECAEENESPPMPGSDYCTWSPDNDCYVNGWPQCCMEDDQDCPPDRRPRCDNHDTTGWDYCTWSPDESCYESGWPACCARFDGTNCPTDTPNCDVQPIESRQNSIEVKFLRSGR